MSSKIDGPANSGAVNAPGVRRLPRRDYVLIPLLIVCTTGVLFAAAELGTRLLWPAYSETGCVVRSKFHTAYPRPNCSEKEKIPEGPWLTYDYNACGYRTPDPCGPKPEGALRLVFLGSSIVQGYHVPYAQTFTALTTRGLSVATGREVQNENLGFEGLSPLAIYRRMPEVLALHPDLVIFAVSPFELEEKTDPVQLEARNDPTRRFDRPTVTINVSPLKRLATMMQASRSVVIAQHFLFSNSDTYLRLSLSRGDKTGYLRTPLPAAWQDRFADFSLILTDMANRLRAAGIPFIVMVVPSHQIGALLSSREHPPGTDPFEFGRNVQLLARRLGIVCVDGTAAMSREAQPDRLFYPAESHLNSAGHAVIARALLAALEALVL